MKLFEVSYKKRLKPSHSWTRIGHVLVNANSRFEIHQIIENGNKGCQVEVIDIKEK